MPLAPCARLSLTSEPWMFDDVSAGIINLVPHEGKTVFIPDGSGVWQSYDLPDAGLSVSLSSLPANSQHDLFLARLNGSTVLAHAPMVLNGQTSVGLVQVFGAPQGGLIDNGGLAAACDGNPIKNYMQSARSHGAVSGYSNASAYGFHFSTAQNIRQLKLWSATDNGFSGNNLAIDWQLRVGPTVASSTLLASGTAPAGVAQNFTIDYPGMATDQDWWVVFNGAGLYAIYLAQMSAFVDGAGGQQTTSRGIMRVAGMPVNASELPLIYDAGSFTAPTAQAVYLGSVGIGSVAGIARADFSLKPDARMDVWNYFHPAPCYLHSGFDGPPVNNDRIYTPFDSSNSGQNYNFGPAMGRGDIRISVLSGMKRRYAAPSYEQAYFLNTGAAPGAVWWGIGVDQSSVPSGGPWGQIVFDNTGIANGDGGMKAECPVTAFEGPKTFYAIEGKRGDVKGFWGEENQLLDLHWEY